MTLMAAYKGELASLHAELLRGLGGYGPDFPQMEPIDQLDAASARHDASGVRFEFLSSHSLLEPLAITADAGWTRAQTFPALFGAQRRGRINQRGLQRGYDARQARDRTERQRRHRERRGIMRLHAVEQARN